MRTDRQEVGAECVEGDGHVPRRLRGVDMHQHTEFTARRDHLDDGLHCAHFVIGPLHVHECRVGADGSPQRVVVDAPEAVDGHDHRFARPQGGLAHRRVLDGGEDLMRAARRRLGWTQLDLAQHAAH